MKNISRFTIALAILMACAFAQAPAAPQFSADTTLTGQRMPEPSKGKVFFDQGNMRMDMTTPQRGDMSIIHDFKNKTSYMLMHDNKMYMEMTAGQGGRRGPRMQEIRALGENPCADEEGVTCKKVAEETVNGRDCDKWEFASSDPAKTRTEWIDKKLHVPVKTVFADSTFELSNIQEGPQDKSRFEVPSDYQKLDPSMMGGQGRGPGL